MYQKKGISGKKAYNLIKMQKDICASVNNDG
jgi:hypothetical protein